MPLKAFVKVGSITNLSDARYCAGMGVDMLGFCTTEGRENYVKPGQYQEIRGWINGPLVVAEVYGIRNPNELIEIIENYKPNYVEMSLGELVFFSSLPLPLILSIQENDVINNLSIQPEFVICKKVFETPFPLLLEIKSKLEVKSLLENQYVKGFVLQGTTEIKPGLKDYEAITDVLELLDVED